MLRARPVLGGVRLARRAVLAPARVSVVPGPQRSRALALGRRGMCAEGKAKPGASAKTETAAADTASAQNQQNQQVPMVVTAIRGAKTTATGALWVGIAGLTAVCGFLIVRELAPTRMSPNGVFNDALAVIQSNEHVSRRLGGSVTGYGMDHGGSREGRRNFIQNVKWTDEEGVKRVRVKFNVEGSRTKAKVFAEKTESMGSGEFYYLIVTPTRGAPIYIVDHRPVLTRKQRQEKAVRVLTRAGAKLYGNVKEEWTRKQLAEFGTSARKLRYVQCDEGSDRCLAEGVQGVPLWRIAGSDFPGFRDLEDLEALALSVSKVNEKAKGEEQTEQKHDLSGKEEGLGTRSEGEAVDRL